jgi:TonB-dependent starch-binding outer membrane protein SusC
MRWIRNLPVMALAALMSVFVAQDAAAQAGGTLTGIVREQGTERPLPGVVVQVDGTQITSLTNEQGRYLIQNVPAGRYTVRAQVLGYAPAPQPVTIVAGETAQLNFMLQQTAIALDEVVVTGTAGRQERRAQPAVIATIGAAEIVAQAPVANVAQIMTARTPGVSIVQSSGTAGTAQQIRIRGAASINLSNEPLIYIDGVLADSRIQSRGFGVGGQAASRLNDINPEDIESIEIVKGPAAATLYGADASAGVIQIITKRGRIGGERFNQTITAEYTTIDHNFTPPDNFINCAAAWTNPATSPLTVACHGQPAGTLVQDNPLQRQNVFRTGEFRSLNWTGRGGGQNYGYFVSLGSDNELGTLPNNEYGRNTGRFNFSFTPRPDLHVEGGYGFMRVNTRLPDNDNNGFGFMAALLGNPATAGSTQDGWFGNFRTAEAISLLENRNVTMRNQPNLTLRYTPLPWFSNRLTVGADISRSEATGFVPRSDVAIFSARLANGDITETNTNFDTYTVDYLGNLQHRFGAEQQLSSDLSFGLQINSRRDEFVQANGNGLVTNAARAVSAAAERTGTHQRFETRQVGWLSQWQGGWQDRLFLQVGARFDQNSTFGREAEGIFLPKVGVSYVVSEEPFWAENIGFMNTFRVRAAYGTTGRSPGAGAALETYQAAPMALTATTTAGGVVPQNPGNLLLRPERGQEFEAGFDAGMFGDRVGVEFTLFNKQTRDLLLLRPLAPSLGFQANPWQNIGEVVNRGVELGIRGQILQTANFGWDARLNMNTLHNEITSLGEVDPFNVTTAFNRHVPGYQLGSFFSLRSREIITQAGDDRCPLVQGQRVACVIVSDTLEHTGNLLPTFEGAFSSNLNFRRNVRLYAQLDWKSGQSMFNNTAFFRETQVVRARERLVPDALTEEERLRRYGPFVREGVTETYAGLTPNQRQAGLGDMREAYHESADFARLREVSLTFLLPTEWANAFRATNASLTLAGRNLALWTDYSGPDPEVISGIATNQFLRQDFLTVPPDRRFVMRVNFGF